jgi:hypothetical protein
MASATSLPLASIVTPLQSRGASAAAQRSCSAWSASRIRLSAPASSPSMLVRLRRTCKAEGRDGSGNGGVSRALFGREGVHNRSLFTVHGPLANELVGAPKRCRSGICTKCEMHRGAAARATARTQTIGHSVLPGAHALHAVRGPSSARCSRRRVWLTSFWPRCLVPFIYAYLLNMERLPECHLFNVTLPISTNWTGVIWIQVWKRSGRGRRPRRARVPQLHRVQFPGGLLRDGGSRRRASLGTSLTARSTGRFIGMAQIPASNTPSVGTRSSRFVSLSL